MQGEPDGDDFDKAIGKVREVFPFVSRVENVVSASLIAKRAISVNRRLLYLRFGDKGEVIATPNIPEVHYNQGRTLEVK